MAKIEKVNVNHNVNVIIKCYVIFVSKRIVRRAMGRWLQISYLVINNFV